MRKTLLFLFAACTTLAAFSQDLNPCGSTEGRSPWLKSFQKGEIPVAERSGDLSLAISVHLLGNDNGQSPFSLQRTLQSLAGLERDFEQADIRFYANLPFDTIYSSQYNDHQTVLDGADMMFTYNRDSSLNLYFVQNPAGNCGYNLPYAGIAVATQCAGPNSVTLSHEVGHGLRLPHPFLGWEGGQTADGSVPANFSVRAPRFVTYDYTYFKDTLIRDTIIIDTAIVDLVARTNCTEAADGFCDTPADYYAARWTCDNNGQSITQIDPDNVTFRSDGSLIMGYANDACQSRFTEQQIAAMRTFAHDQRSSWIRAGLDTTLVTTQVEPAYVNGDYLDLDGVLRFTPAEGATHYYLQISERASFSNLIVDTVITTTELALNQDDFLPDRRYNWKVYPFNNHSFRQGFSPSFNFIAPSVVSSKEAFRQNLSLSPNPVSMGDKVTFGAYWAGGKVFFFDAMGRECFQAKVSSDGSIVIPSTMIPALYSIKLFKESEHRVASARLMVTN